MLSYHLRVCLDFIIKLDDTKRKQILRTSVILMNAERILNEYRLGNL